MHDLPTFVRFVQDDRSSVDEPRSIIEMEGRNRHISKELDFQFSWLDVHVWRRRLSTLDLLEHDLEALLKFSPSAGTFWHGTRIKHSCIVIESQSKVLPVQVVECPDEMRQRLADSRVRRL